MKRIIYIAGPMTVLAESNYNFEAFHRTAAEWEERGYHVLNPATHFNGAQDADYSHYMRASIHDLLMAEAIALLPGWEQSAGATLEATIAERLDLKFYDALTGEWIQPPESVRYECFVPAEEPEVYPPPGLPG